MLSIEEPDRLKWFEALVVVNETVFDAVCCSILRRLFSFMQEAMISDADKSFEKLIRDYLIGSNEFKEIIVGDLPNELRNNQPCATYLAWSLKTFFDEWVYASVKEMIQSSNPSSVA